MAYSLLKFGSKGGDVKKLQELLNLRGYKLDTDGIFGSKTQSALRDYQSKNNLSVDGIAGNYTWGSLSTTPGYSSAATQSANGTLSQYENNRPMYSPSAGLTELYGQLSQYENNKPGAYSSQYTEQIAALLDKIQNRKAFNYDFSSDPLYQQSKAQYMAQGKAAMQDTVGQAAAMSGGYGNSYAATAGQQTYNNYLQGLNDTIPELYSAALQKYELEGSDMYNQLSMYQGLDNADYSKYRDSVSDYYNELQHFYNKYSDMSAQEYNYYVNNLAAWQADRAYYYAKQQDAQSQSNWEQEFNLAKSKSSGSSGGSGSGGGGISLDDLTAYLDGMSAWEQYRAMNDPDTLGLLNELADAEGYDVNELLQWFKEKYLPKQGSATPTVKAPHSGGYGHYTK